VLVTERTPSVAETPCNKSRDASKIWEANNSREARTEGIPATVRMPVKAQTITKLRFKEREVNNRRDPSNTNNAHNSTDLNNS
jgi:hypothetical protein